MTSLTELSIYGFAVCEVAAPRPDGRCSCRLGADCPNPAKHPVGRHWRTSAVRRWERFQDTLGETRLPVCARLAPATSYGLIPVSGTGTLVIDVDDPSVELPIPDTYTVTRASAPSGRGHYYLVLPRDISDADVPRTYAGGEVRIAGSGYVVGAGCRHAASGDIYEANDLGVAYATEELIEALRAAPAVRRRASGEVEAVIGSRHQWLTQQARKLRGWGRDREDIEEELRALNEEYCEPPLSEQEAEFDRIARWAVREIDPDRPISVRRRNARSAFRARHGRSTGGGRRGN